MNWGGGLTTWLAALAGLEDIEHEAEEREREAAIREHRPCWPCHGTGIHDRWNRHGPRLEDGGHITLEVCDVCGGSGLDIELGVSCAG